MPSSASTTEAIVIVSDCRRRFMIFHLQFQISLVRCYYFIFMLPALLAQQLNCETLTAFKIKLRLCYPSPYSTDVFKYYVIGIK